MMFQVLNAASQKLVKDILLAHQQDMEASSEAAVSEGLSLPKRKHAERDDGLRVAAKKRTSTAREFRKHRK